MPIVESPAGSGPGAFKQEIISALWRAVDACPEILSATLAGSFARGSTLEGISDIDTICIVERLDAGLFASIQDAFRSALAPVLDAAGWALRINPTLGPLKFNDAQTAVLHLMLYTAEGHRDHVINSPFTCLDWQRSATIRGLEMAQVYPVFALQPRHFFGARRSARDYLADLRAGVVSYRELRFDGGYHEVKLGQPMSVRDQHEFAYHIFRFLMQNLLKLVNRSNAVADGEELLAQYGAVFPQGMEEATPLYRDLARRKREADFTPPVSELLTRVAAFVQVFEDQFRGAFERDAVRHVVLRHAATAANHGSGMAARLQGRSDHPILPMAETAIVQARQACLAIGVRQTIASPLRRTQETLVAVLPDLPRTVEPQLTEINYGDCEGLTAGEAVARHPALGEAWQAGLDPAFPGGESSGAVLARARTALAGLTGQPSTAICSHNVVLRELIGELMQIPPAQRFRLSIPHTTPITLVHSQRFGWFADLDAEVERGIFAGFLKGTR